MLDWMFMIFLIIAFILIVLAIQYHDDPFWGGLFTVLDIIMWILLASTVLEIESPAYIFNTTTAVSYTHLTLPTNREV